MIEESSRLIRRAFSSRRRRRRCEKANGPDLLRVPKIYPLRATRSNPLEQSLDTIPSDLLSEACSFSCSSNISSDKAG
ncbi:unnamed protein product [Protopolystoma xenopodis]|uniref:Uncharacterized protein n=1 Tax=Protopolystoma xenopodis TaxID=117903 RepID=A0A3S5CI52_9PLAT|nr:unnamed protein product [Protopolystoma xenopodis]